MKIRRGFVSNSSSTSFTCEISGDTESGYDIGMTDAGMYSCRSDHYMCECYVEEFIEKLAAQGIDAIMAAMPDEDDQDMRDALEEEYDAACITQEVSADDLYNMVESMLGDFDGRGALPQGMCPICQLEHVSRPDVIRYLLMCRDCTVEDLRVEIKQRYGGSPADFQDAIRGIRVY